MDLAAVLLLGLTVGGTSCAMVQGGLLAGVATRHTGCATLDHPDPDLAGSASRVVALRSDAVPVAGFLVGKLASHGALGAVLGLVGAAVPVGAAARGAMQVVVGALVLALGLGQLGMPWLRRMAGWRLGGHGPHDGRGSGGLAAATAAGFATVAVPCGVTVAVEALAATAGSAAAGAAVMAVFVVGTWPLFGVLGLLVRGVVRAWRGRLRLVTAAALVAAGAWTAVGGLVAAGMPVPGTRAATADVTDGVVAVAAGHQTVTVTVGPNGFAPADVVIRAGLSTTLVLRARHAAGCVRTVVIAGRAGEWVLPADGDISVDLGVPAAGVVRYSCVMGMYTARLTAR